MAAVRRSAPRDASPRSVLREPAFLRLWTASTASGLATWALPFVLGLAVVEGSLTALGLGIVLAVRTAGFLVAVPVAGVYADRHDRRLVVLVAAGGAAGATLVTAAGLGTDLVLMCAGSLVAGAGQGACRPALSALTADVVDLGRRQAANALLTLAVRACVLVAPAATALAAVVVGPRALLLGLAGLWAVAAVAAPPGAVGRVGSGTDDGGAFWVQLTDGWREARRHRWFVAGLVALAAVIMTGYSATAVVLPLLARERGEGEALLAAALTGYTAGALLGAVLMARWRPAAQGWTALAGLGIYAVVPLALLVPSPVPVVVAAYVVAGVGIELFNVPWFTATQREVEPRLLGRVSSIDFLVSYGLAPLGLAVIAPAVDAVGVPTVLGVCAAVCLLAPALAAATRTARDFGARPT